MGYANDVDDDDEAHAYACHIETIRARELPDSITSLNLDAAGCPPAACSVLNAVHADLVSGPRISNPHSDSHSGRQTRQRIDGVRALVCQELFGVERRGGPISSDAEDNSGWELAFSSGTTASIQTVARSFAFGQQGRLAYYEQSHSSLYGIRDIVCMERNAAGVDVVTNDDDILQWLRSAVELDGYSLLALPLQCNATGRRFQSLVRRVLAERLALERRRNGRRNVFLLLDAAAYLSPSSRLQMGSGNGGDSGRQPDFLCFSFLKVLGYPSGLGGLLVLRRAAHALAEKHYYGGGALEASTARTTWRKPARELHEMLEDGTLNLYGIVAVEVALATMRSLDMLGAWHASSTYVDGLTVRLWNALNDLEHGDGSRMCEMYSDKPQHWGGEGWGTLLSQGPIVLFNLLRPNRGNSTRQSLPERRIDPAEVDRLACLEDIHLRTGRMCNIGAITAALGVSDEDIQALWERGIGCGGVVDRKASVCSIGEAEEDARLRALVSGAIRVSLCAWNTGRDIDRLVAFIRKYFWIDEGEDLHDDVDEFVSCSAGDDDYEEDDDGTHSSVFSRSTLNCSSSSSSVLETDLERVTTHNHILKEAYVYPIKSCAAQRITDSWRVTEAGLEYDRGFCVVDLTTGKVLSQKRVPAMARIRPTIQREAGAMVVRFFDEHNALVDSIVVVLDEGEDSQPRRRQYDMCGIAVNPVALTDTKVQVAFSAFLGRRCTLASGGRVRNGVPLRLSNESPFLMITSESVQKICDWIRDDEKGSDDVVPAEHVSMAFRANFVVAAHNDGRKNPAPRTPFYEDAAQQVRIGPHTTFIVLGPCRRCEMIALDATTGRRTPHVFSAVARHRRCRQGGMKGRILFGQHMMLRDGQRSSCYIAPGMPVDIKGDRSATP